MTAASAAPISVPPRAVVEGLVRESVYRHLGLPVPGAARAPSPLVVNVSARHCHLTESAVEELFGRGHRLREMKPLYQDGYFAAEETVTLVGPRSRVISNLRVLGPCREINQVELSYTDAVALGFDAPLRLSGDTGGTPGCMLMGPAGFLEMEEGVIRAMRHVHLGPADAAFYGVSGGDHLRLRVGGACGVNFDRVVARVGDGIKLEVHLDTDEGNACGLQPDTPCELLV